DGAQVGHWRAVAGGRGRGGQGDVQDLEDVLGGGAALRAGVVLGGDGAQRQVSLRGEQQHQQRRLIRQVAVQQPESGLDGDQGRGHGRGQLQDQRGQKGDA